MSKCIESFKNFITVQPSEEKVSVHIVISLGIRLYEVIVTHLVDVSSRPRSGQYFKSSTLGVLLQALHCTGRLNN